MINNCVNNNKTNIAIWLLQVSQDGNTTSSSLTFQPTLLHHNKIITCKAENPKVPNGVAEDTWKLNVFCKYASSLRIHNRHKTELHANDRWESEFFRRFPIRIVMNSIKKTIFIDCRLSKRYICDYCLVYI